MSSKPGIIGRYRPRVVTLLVLLAVTAATVLANGIPQDVKRVSGTPSRYCQEFDYGWPLVWCRRGLTRQPAPAGAAAPGAKQGWPGAWIETWHVEHYRLPALAVNLATWLAFLAAAGIPWEWLMRRYRPRLRWSLRTMLVTMGLLAVFFAWCSALRRRAHLQDSVIAAAEVRGADFDIERWGPQWLELFCSDRFRRRIVGATLSLGHEDDGDVDAELLTRIGSLPHLRRLELAVSSWAPSMGNVVGGMRQIRQLRIDNTDGFVEAHERGLEDFYSAVGKLKRLELLSLSPSMFSFSSGDLRHLAGLTELKSLRMDTRYAWSYGEEGFEKLSRLGRWPALAHLPPLPRLEALAFHCDLVSANDLRRIAALPSLKALDLSGSRFVDHAALAELTSLVSLEELAIDNVSAEVIESLTTLKRLKALHVCETFTGAFLENDSQDFALPDEADRWRRAFAALRRSNPGIEIDDDVSWFDERHGWREIDAPHRGFARPRKPRGWGFF